MCLTSKISHYCMSVLIQQDIVAAKIKCSTRNGSPNMLFQPVNTPRKQKTKNKKTENNRQLLCPPVEVSVDDGLGEIVQVLHTLGHVDGDDELGLQVDQPAH